MKKFSEIEIGEEFWWPAGAEFPDTFIKTYECLLNGTMAPVNCVRTSKSVCPGLPSIFELDDIVERPEEEIDYRAVIAELITRLNKDSDK